MLQGRAGRAGSPFLLCSPRLALFQDSDTEETPSVLTELHTDLCEEVMQW